MRISRGMKVVGEFEGLRGECCCGVFGYLDSSSCSWCIRCIACEERYILWI
jgi:hypothetical protein